VVINSTPRDLCPGFYLSKSEIDEFIKKARRIPDFNMFERKEGEPALCALAFNAKLKDGRQVALYIDETRRGLLASGKDDGGADEYYYCGECKSKKFSSPPGPPSGVLISEVDDKSR